jgi:cysteinyl-tRNA synthetase
MLLAALLACAGAMNGRAGAAASEESWPRRALRSATSFGYQLQNIDPAAVARSSCSVFIVDFANDQGRPFSRAEVAAMQRREDGGRRLVLAYLSIGEAENYRSYWRADWASSPPAWLSGENPDWPGNFYVRYWFEDWQKLIFGSDESYLDRLLAAGFDGVYLDRVDAYEHWRKERPEGELDMSSFVERLAGHARRRNAEFLVVPQNGERLLGREPYLAAIDGIGKEDLFFGSRDPDKPTPAGEQRESLRWLALAQASDLPVLLIEYATDPPRREHILAQGSKLGFVTLIASRDLSSSSACR